MKAFALAFLLFATPIVIDTTKLADGASDVRREGSRTVAVTRNGNTVTVRVDEGRRTDTITMTRQPDGKLTISQSDNGQPRQFLSLDRPPVIVDGVDLESFLGQTMTRKEIDVVPAPQRETAERGPRYFVCPRDETMVRVKPGLAPAELKCPIDGTPMKAGTGSDSQIFLLH